ncbi:putative ABC-class ATPase [Kineococcus xinjiangensis]|uniref:Putative ABC-class ATPase n=1 Tax=Kineococcus xinjiangensis TaxID=512762 RepID=A0A2S6IJB8_9ACTN|nr:ABC-ATPase domain-containing protein [Kineococcus xinjiangensis]PPK94275.1 putative ABC-class ATPase [Kineococcus xinjiangensis]
MTSTSARRDLAATLHELHGAPYARYRSLQGSWVLPLGDAEAELRVVRAQADPFAPPSRFEVRLGAGVLAAPSGLWSSPVRARALAAHLARTAAVVAGAELRIDAGGQEVLRRTSCEVLPDGSAVLRFAAHLPGPRRRVDGRGAARLLAGELPQVVAALRHDALDAAEVRRFVDTVDDADTLRRRLPELGLVAFVADGAVLARRSGVDPRPAVGAVPFAAPPQLRVEVDLPHAGRVSGAGVPEGVVLVVGGGFHGKSTLLRALEAGVNDHVPGDGRELVVTRSDAVAVRAEDGRAVTRVDVGAFVRSLPGGLDPADFSTAEASGSTSQAAAVLEAVEAGAGVLLLDEDTTATNLMVRDARMQALVAKEREPLNPFVDLVRSLHRDRGVSTVLVVGSSGDYLDVADRVLLMDSYVPSDVTARAREVAARPTGRVAEAGTFPPVRHRVVDPSSVDASARGRVRVAARGTDALLLGEHEVDVRAVRQFVDAPHVVGAGLALARLVGAGHLDSRRTLAQALDLLDADLAEDRPGALERLLGGVAVDAAVPRRFEVAAALDRLRGLRVLRLTEG